MISDCIPLNITESILTSTSGDHIPNSVKVIE